ncbi:putative periplasmic lipoprotein [Chromobacterium paludis]|uniref:Prokaryotic membrane lipolipid attachment site family protein n=1 Tax=Chromobacterium paludis TaxID=2605945 RepID=A0A5C1DP39_9NEIS|nr:hypothetical protein [Chromobacterium paludis]QEL57887.1 hypothetical protein FYK34_12265 [Chromobacterium paludis]
MKKLIIGLTLLGGLSACSSLQQPAAPVHGGPVAVRPPHPVAAPQPNKQAQLLDEADGLADRVKAGELSRTAAADLLNAARLRIVGSNAVDNDTFALYRELTAERDAGRIDSDVFRAKLEAHLRGWLRRWPQYAPKPADPAFTNFLLKLYGLPPLGY